MEYVVLIDVEGETRYVPDSRSDSWSDKAGPKLFETIEEAEAECSNWSTGRVYFSWIAGYLDALYASRNSRKKEKHL